MSVQDARALNDEFGSELGDFERFGDMSALAKVPAYKAYLAKVDNYPVLSPEAQLELVVQVQDGQAAAEKLKTIDPKDRVTATRLRRKARQGEEAMEFLVGSNLRLVLMIAREIGASRKGDRLYEILPDLVQEGNLGLMEAVRRFDPARGTPFHTFAAQRIRQFVRDALNKSGMINVPDSWTKLARIVVGVRSELQAELGRDPSIEEIRERAFEHCMAWAYPRIPDGYDDPEEGALAVLRKQGLLRALQDIEEVLQLTAMAGSLDAPLSESDEDSGSFGDMLPDDQADPGFGEVERAELREALMLALGGFPDREREIIMLRYGFVDGEVWTYAKLGERFGVSSERIRQLEQRVLERLASPHAQYVHLSAHLESQVDVAVEESETRTAVNRMRQRRKRK